MQVLPLIVPKTWGQEIWLVNEPEYCCKILKVNKGASGSLHYHPIKKETFIIKEGAIELTWGGKRRILYEGEEAITILPKILHRFRALQDSSILEVSTHHDDNDVVRIEKSNDNKPNTL